LALVPAAALVGGDVGRVGDVVRDDHRRARGRARVAPDDEETDDREENEREDGFHGSPPAPDARRRKLSHTVGSGPASPWTSARPRDRNRAGSLTARVARRLRMANACAALPPTSRKRTSPGAPRPTRPSRSRASARRPPPRRTAPPTRCWRAST